MDKKVQIPIESEDWYKALIDDIHSTIVEGVFNSRWFLLKAWHDVGKLILENEKKFQERGIYGEGITKHIALSVGKSQRSIQYAVKFAKKYPDINKLPGGKNISWHKVVTNLLPDSKKDRPILEQIRILIDGNTLIIPRKYQYYKIIYR